MPIGGLTITDQPGAIGTVNPIFTEVFATLGNFVSAFARGLQAGLYQITQNNLLIRYDGTVLTGSGKYTLKADFMADATTGGLPSGLYQAEAKFYFCDGLGNAQEVVVIKSYPTMTALKDDFTAGNLMSGGTYQVVHANYTVMATFNGTSLFSYGTSDTLAAMLTASFFGKGRWQVTGANCNLEFKSNGTAYIGSGNYAILAELFADNSSGSLPVGNYFVGDSEYKCIGPKQIITANEPFGLKPYIGQVATRCGWMEGPFSAGNWYLDGATIHQATEHLTSIKVIHPNWASTASTAIDTGTGGTMTLSVSIEYPAGVFTDVTFDGGNPIATVLSGENTNPDWCVVDIPKGAWFAVHYNGHSPVALARTSINYTPPLSSWGFKEGQNHTNGSPVTNNLHTNSPVYSNAGVVLRPYAIVGMTIRPSVFILGDSIDAGYSDVADSAGVMGHLERAIPYGVINASIPGDRLGYQITGTTCAKRAAFAQYCSHVIVGAGINDLSAGTTPATLAGYHATLKTKYFANKPYFIRTILPRTTGTWDTSAAQTITAYDANISAMNDLIMAGNISGQNGAINTHDIFADTYANNIWKAFGSPANAITTDGIHPNHKGYVYGASNLNLAFLNK